MQKRIKSYGKRYALANVKVKISRLKIFKVLFGCLILIEIVLGVLWALGY